jgi:anaerobic selenocysteine-containing dehydrogenase
MVSIADELPPLTCISPPAHSFLNSTFVNLERFQRREGQPLLQIHPQDAAARGIGDGDLVAVGNGLGTVQLAATVTDAIVPGTVLAPGIWWAKFSPDGRNINQVTPQDEADMGAGARFYDVLVTVRRSE